MFHTAFKLIVWTGEIDADRIVSGNQSPPFCLNKHNGIDVTVDSRGAPTTFMFIAGSRRNSVRKAPPSPRPGPSLEARSRHFEQWPKPMSFLARFLMHGLACLALPAAFAQGYSLWAKWVAPPVARGIALGLAMELIFYFFVALNVFMILSGSRKIRCGLAGAVVAAILLYLLPQHPIRGPGIALLCGGLCLLAIALTDPLETLLRKLRPFAEGDP